MSLTRFAPALVAALVLAGCENAPENYIAPVESAPRSEADTATTAELMSRNLKTSELGVGRLKDPAKTVGYAAGSTEPGEKLLDGALVVEHVTREDADNHFCVTVSLFNNREDASAAFEWRIAFFNDKNVEVTSLQPGWKARSIEAKRWGNVSNSATVRGATRFKVEVRAPGSGETPPPQ
jgi:hypothetical protein